MLILLINHTTTVNSLKDLSHGTHVLRISLETAPNIVSQSQYDFLS